MTNSIVVSYFCKKCEEEFDVEVWPVVEARTYGPPEDCYPEEGGEVEPDQCPKCEHPVDEAEAHQLASDWVEGRREDYDDN